MCFEPFASHLWLSRGTQKSLKDFCFLCALPLCTSFADLKSICFLGEAFWEQFQALLRNLRDLLHQRLFVGSKRDIESRHVKVVSDAKGNLFLKEELHMSFART